MKWFPTGDDGIDRLSFCFTSSFIGVVLSSCVVCWWMKNKSVTQQNSKFHNTEINEILESCHRTAPNAGLKVGPPPEFLQWWEECYNYAWVLVHAWRKEEPEIFFFWKWMFDIFQEKIPHWAFFKSLILLFYFIFYFLFCLLFLFLAVSCLLLLLFIYFLLESFCWMMPPYFMQIFCPLFPWDMSLRTQGW